MVEAESPSASLPSSAISASSKAPVEMPFRESGSAPLDHDDFGLNPSKIMNVIDSKSLERDAGGKPVSTFPHTALGSSIGAHREAKSSTKIGSAFADAVTDVRAPYRDGTDAGHDLALGQRPVAPQPPAAIIGPLVGMGAEPNRNLGFDGLPQ
jgi:hypothetical protein